MKSYRYFDLIMVAFVTVLLISNIASSAKIVDFGISIGWLRLAFDAGTLLFPLSYIFDDVLTEVYGYARSRRVIWAGFLEHSPADDIRDIIVELENKKSVTSVMTGEVFPIRVSAVHLFGGSFGGPAVLLNTDLPIVKKVIAHSPVIDRSVEGEDEPFDEFVRYSCQGFGGAYRTKTPLDWQKLTKTDFYNPVAHIEKIDGRKVFILHAKDDTNVPVDPVVPFAKKIGATYYLKPHGGHSIKFEHRFLWKKVEAFLKKR
jgi:pimeloyl-ACP methyl ester carboxylesterase